MSIPTPEEYAKTRRRGGLPCITCESPHRAQLEASYANGVPVAALAGWLELYHPEHAIRLTTLFNHFRNGHARNPDA